MHDTCKCHAVECRRSPVIVWWPKCGCSRESGYMRRSTDLRSEKFGGLTVAVLRIHVEEQLILLSLCKILVNAKL
jgi:hypothetical protein